MSQKHGSFCVQGEILLSEAFGSFTDATATIYLEEVSRVDAPSKTIAKQVINHIEHRQGTDQRVAFALKGARMSEQASYSIRAHVSLQGDEQIHTGDYVTVQNYPVLMLETLHPVLIQVQAVK